MRCDHSYWTYHGTCGYDLSAGLGVFKRREMSNVESKEWIELTDMGGLANPPLGPVPPGFYIVEFEKGVDLPILNQRELRHDEVKGWCLPSGPRFYCDPFTRFVRCKRIGD